MSAQAQRYRRPAVQGASSLAQERIPLTNERRGMLAKVHVARKELGLTEDAYRDVVQRITGTSSAGAASDAALHRLLGEFKRLGWSPSSRQYGKRRADKAQVRMIYAVWADLAPYVRAHDDEALRSFAARQTRSKLHPDGISAPEFLDGAQANRVLEGLKAWLAREIAKAVVPSDGERV